MTYDPDARRDTLLGERITALIRARGPLAVKRYMQMCLTDDDYGYYRRHPAIGAAADFITAPEISQTFGELIGLWAAVVWRQWGSPAAINLVELGPGRGTMLADALRAAARVSGFHDAMRLVLVETSEALREVQVATLHGYAPAITYLEPGEPFPDGPMILVANEMLDCIPVGQIVKCASAAGPAGWCQRMVVVDDAGRLQFGIGGPVRTRPEAHASFLDDAPLGAIVEDRNVRGLAAELSQAAGKAPVAALFIDYGHVESGVGDTLQAVRHHRPEHPLTSPGEADLTAQVDFAALVATLTDEARRAAVALSFDGPVTQSEFLGSLGIMERASRLMSDNPPKANEIETAIARLMAPTGMGTRFKVVGLRSPGLPPLPGFPPPLR